MIGSDSNPAILARSFPSHVILLEQSSPSRVRFAAPNNGAPLTAPGRSKTTPPTMRGKTLTERQREFDNGGAEYRDPLHLTGAAARRLSRCTLAWTVARDTLPDATGHGDPVFGPPVLAHTLSRSSHPLLLPRLV